MTNNSKKRKFLATSLTATMVATAVAPVAGFAAETPKLTDIEGHWGEAAIKDLVERGIIEGKGDNTYDPNGNLTRASAASIFAKALKLEIDKDAKAPFADVADDHWGNAVIAAVVKAGIFQGNDKDEFEPNKALTRQAAAEVIVKAYGLELDENNKVTFPDNTVAWSKDKIDILASLGILQGDNTGKVNPTKDVSRAAIAEMMYKTLNYVESAEANVESVSAINQNTLLLEGVGLKKLQLSDLTLADNEVASITASDNGKSATVKFKHNFPNAEEQTVTVKQGEVTKEFKFTFDIGEITAVSLDAKTYDDDTVGQLLTFKVNGQTTTTDSDFLRQQGFDVNFVAETANGTPANIFYGGSSASATGLLNDTNAHGVYKVEVQLIKGGVVVYSSVANITITDVESNTTAINEVEFKNYGVDKSTGGSDDFKMNSTTLVIDEKAELSSIKANANGKTDVSLIATSAVVESSNPAVISVSGAAGQPKIITANSVGTANITVTVGGVSKVVSFTVTNKARAVNKITPSESTVKVVKDQIREIQITAADQYGDPIVLASADVEEDYPKNALKAPLVDSLDIVTLTTGKAAAVEATAKQGFWIEGKQVGNGTIVLKDTKGKVLGNIAVQVTDKTDTGSTRVEHTVASTGKHEVKPTEKIEYQVAKYTTAGFYNGNAELVDTTALNTLKTKLDDTADLTIALKAYKVALGKVVALPASAVQADFNALNIATLFNDIDAATSGVVPTTTAVTWDTDLTTTQAAATTALSAVTADLDNAEQALSAVQDEIKTTFHVKSIDTTIATVSADAVTDKFTVTGVKAGKTDIHIVNANGLTVHKYTVTVKAPEHNITKVNYNTLKNITVAGESITATTALDVRPEIGLKDSIVYGIEHDVASAKKVRLTTTVNTVAVTDSSLTPIIYIDQDDDGTFDPDKDILLGTVKAEILTGGKGQLSAAGTLSSVTTAIGDKGQVLFRIIGGDSVDNKDTVASTIINVDVK